MMIMIEFPSPNFKIEHKNNRPYIFDEIRRRWILLQDEEWVRQNFVQYLVQVMKYPKSFIALEKEIYLGELKKRFDILVYDQNHKPWMLIECKSEKVPINDKVLQQILRYNQKLPSKYLVLTNGGYTFGWQNKNGAMLELQSLPEFGTNY